MTARRILTLAGAIALTALLTACAGTSTPSTPSVKAGGASSSVSSTATTTVQPAPRLTESNPPGDIPDSTAYVVFSPAGGGYSVKIPEGWARTSGTTTSFTDKLNRIEMSTAVMRNRPTVDSVSKTDAASLRARVPKFAMGRVSIVVRHGGRAILLTYQGDSAPDQVTGKVVRDAFERYTFYRVGRAGAGRRVDLTLSGPTNADNVDPWRTVSDSLRWK